MNKQKNKFSWGDTVKIKHAAPRDLHPGSIVSVCALVEINEEDLRMDPALVESTWLYTVEFGDGSSIEVPECYLEKYKNEKTNMHNQPPHQFTIDKIIELVESWLITGKLDSDMLAENFKFFSPFWESNDRAAFIEKFQDPSIYQKTSLSNILKFDPIFKLKDSEENHFAIVLQYHTKNGCSVWETVLGSVQNSKLVELRSIYDLKQTKRAHNLE